MFTGIIEQFGTVIKIEKEGSNTHFHVSSPLAIDLKIDQSVAHNGVCLTVTNINGDTHAVTAIAETWAKTNLDSLKVGETINLERAMSAQARLDGHIVQGHVDTTAVCISIEDMNGSWVYTFRYLPTPELMLVDKGSVCINGVSLTVVNPYEDLFSVAVIPYTYENTTFKQLAVNDVVNLEFDIIGKYIAKYIHLYKNKI